MNRLHNLICSSGRWRRHVERELIPWGLEGVDLGDRVLEIGPGFGATTRLLVGQLGSLEVLELDPAYCDRLRAELGDRARVTQGDATEMPYRDGTFSGAVCFTMLHHIPSPGLQDRAFSEVARVLAPGGVFAGTDSLGTGAIFRLIHVGDTMVTIDPGTLPSRLLAAGLDDPAVDVADGSLRFRAGKAA